MSVEIKPGGLMPELNLKEPISNDGKDLIEFSKPYIVEVKISGTSDILFHRWSCEAVEEKATAAKGSKAKKTDIPENYVYRCDDGTIGIPGIYLRQSIIIAAKYQQDPRSPRKSAQDLYKAGIISLTDVASLGKTKWDKLYQCRMVIQKSSITRTRPCFIKGWKATFLLQVQLPEYISFEILTKVITDAGRLVGLGDSRPTYGRFVITSIKKLKD
jgi:hypothetical protein